jgi:tetratricopeptide (TPR) repeat protein
MGLRPRYFSRTEWLGFWITTAISFAVYLYTLAPNVTLEDSGEFLTAGYHWGVPHPPGYPAWAVSVNLFERLIPFGNAAWRGNLMSAFYGAIASGLLTLLACKLAERLWNVERLKGFALPGISREAIILVAGLVAGLVNAFIDTVWSQATITEVYTLNGFFFNLLLLLVLRWFDSPGRWRWPCLVALVFGLGITNHQTLLVAAPAFIFAMYWADRVLYRDCAFLASLSCAIFAWQSALWFMWMFAAGFLLHYLWLMVRQPHAWNVRNLFSATFSMLLATLAMVVFSDADDRPLWIFLSAVLLAAWAGILAFDLLTRHGALRATSPFLLSFLMFVAGSSVYLYMPLSSVTNPPMNWGYTRTVEGFRHHITRGQYERIQTNRPLRVLVGQYNQYFNDLEENFSMPLCLLGVLPLVFFGEFPRREKAYLGFTVLCFVFMGFVLVFLLNAKFDLQSSFIIRVFYSLSHGVYSLWIGLGAIFLLHWAQGAKRALPAFGLALGLVLAALAGFHFERAWAWEAIWLAGAGVFVGTLVRLVQHPGWSRGALAFVAAIPVVPLGMNWAGSEMRGHDFGWLYGHDMLKDCDRDAVVYGGTDPGRFVPTYMIFVESFQPPRWRKDPSFDRRDLYIITQNALADQTYMNYIRGHYDTGREKMDRWYHRLLGRDKLYPKEPLRLPNDNEFNLIFSEVVQAAQNNPQSGVTFLRDNMGKVVRASVQGVEGVFAINGAIAKWIFEMNKAKHSFYVEESYPIPWMYPYLEPFGLFMKLNKEPIKEIPREVVKRDMALWTRLDAELMANPKFLRDDVARKSFSKLRSSIGGVYLFRGMHREAEKSLQQALDFYPASAEARSRLTECLVNQGRFDAAHAICEEWLKLDPFNPAPQDVLAKVSAMRLLIRKEAELAALYPACKNDPQFVLQYAGVLRERGKPAEADRAIDEFLDRAATPSALWLEFIQQFYVPANRLDRIENLLQRLVKREPKNAFAWYTLAVFHASSLRGESACTNLAKAFALDTNLVNTARTDPRFNPIRGMTKFQQLVP